MPRRARTFRPPACASVCAAVAAPASSTPSPSTRSATTTRSSRTTACASSSTGPSLPYVKGAIVDYVESLQGAGFKVDNPNVIAACGCGSSFRVAEEEEVSAV